MTEAVVPQSPEAGKVEELIHDLRRTSTLIYIAVEESVADDISRKLKAAADALATTQARIAEKEGQLERMRARFHASTEFGLALSSEVDGLKAAWGDERAAKEALIARLAELEGAFAAIEEECWSLTCESYPTGGGDAEVFWQVVSHHMTKPKERAESLAQTPLRAVTAAMAKNGRSLCPAQLQSADGSLENRDETAGQEQPKPRSSTAALKHAFVGLLHEIVDLTWSRAYEDTSVPSNEIAREIVETAISTHNAYAPDELYLAATVNEAFPDPRPADGSTAKEAEGATGGNIVKE